ncbi:MAG: fumarylacetoacetate hydrolase family protein [Candidatus Sumerlaeia bacterium]|nr:fumarylacetoacetate hydrolase family protein [Candidatus Sumerlaeia bacterium]
MRLGNFTSPNFAPFFGIEIKNKVLRIPALAETMGLRTNQKAHLSSMLAYLQGLPTSETLMRKMLADVAAAPELAVSNAADGQPHLIPQQELTYLAPVPKPGKIICVGLNYRDHCEEQNKPIPEMPLLFAKFATSVNHHMGEIPLPLKLDPCCDYEAELAIVIGKSATRVSKKNALSHVAGYTILNDVTARTLQKNEKMWIRAKGFDGSAPMGPVLVTPDEIADAGNLDIRCRVNGELRQQSNTSQLIFGIEELIAYISAAITLEPGDVISTGTPGGVGVYREPQIFLQPGDVISCEIASIGKLENRCTK